MLTFDQIPEPVWRRVQQLTGRTDEHFCKCVAAEVVGAWPWAKTEAADEITRLRAALEKIANLSVAQSDRQAWAFCQSTARAALGEQP